MYNNKIDAEAYNDNYISELSIYRSAISATGADVIFEFKELNLINSTDYYVCFYTEDPVSNGNVLEIDGNDNREISNNGKIIVTVTSQSTANVKIYNGSSWDDYSIYIYNGSSWDQY